MTDQDLALFLRAVAVLIRNTAREGLLKREVRLLDDMDRRADELASKNPEQQ